MGHAEQFTETAPRNFNPMSVPGLSAEARKAVNAVFDAMSNWRTEIITNNEKGIEQVIEKMATAARALGWPEQIVDATRAQMQGISKIQIQTMDHMMDAWEEQIKSPSHPSAMLSKLTSFPSFSPSGSWPNADALQKIAMNPFQFYMQFAEQCQKAWADATGASLPPARLHALIAPATPRQHDVAPDLILLPLMLLRI
jgi:hypothetical protein